MADVDLSRLPTGELGWAQLIRDVIDSDDRVERYFLEVKSEVDLTVKADRAKIAKFILGAANRDPEQARRRFGGHALMVLGVGDGQVIGVPPFEAKDLAGSVQKWIGVSGPGWDFERIRIDERDIIVIVVSPPTGDLWTCRADGERLVDGGIYVRQDGETRRATGDEVRLLIERAASTVSSVEVDVTIDGEINAIQIDESKLTEYVRHEAATLREQEYRGGGPRPYGLLTVTPRDPRSREAFLDQVATWERDSLESPTRGVTALAARVRDGIQVRLRNATRTFLRDVRLDILVEDDGVLATDWLKLDKNDPLDLFPGRPRDWGYETFSSMMAPLTLPPRAIRAQNDHGVVRIMCTSPAKLTMHMDALRPKEEHVSDNDEVVLVMFSAPPPERVTARWQVTAQGINDIFEGTVDIPVLDLDWRDVIQT